ncbi:MULTISPECIES: cytochrome-c peroxidase [unclassified Pseudoalteromonas]|uniref:cytochrome-c peroxidase n=1 Tax=unclassified Pseudoalteromonas TaxID=194690 RepID=UPI003014F35E
MLSNQSYTSFPWRICFMIWCSLLALQAAANGDLELREIYSQSSEFWPKAHVDEGVVAEEIGLLPDVSFPKQNPFNVAKLFLGEKLFHDPLLSHSKQIACASCHEPELGWADGKKTSFGHNRQRGKRNAPSIENVAFSTSFFWDGRAKTLEQQALLPIQDPIEMNLSLTDMVSRLKQKPEYKTAFSAAFGDNAITALRVGQALATFQRTIVSRRSDFDMFLMAGKQKTEKLRAIYSNAMSDQAIWGMHLFRTKARCMNCHHGPTFSDNQFHSLGLTYYQRKLQDLGRYLFTQDPSDVGKFKTPSLRGVMNTKPWMHNGVFADMEGLLNFYNAGGAKFTKKEEDPLSPETSKLLHPLNLSKKELDALAAFLQAITASPAVGPSPKFTQ